MSKKALSDASILASTFETLRDGVSIVDLEFNVVKVNAIVEHLYPGERLVGKKCYEAYHRRTTPCEVCPAREALETGEIAYKLQHNRLNDKSYWLDIYAFPLIDPTTEETMGIVKFFRDVTEQKETEEALRASEAKYRTLVENIPAVIFMAPLNDNQAATFVSPQIEFYLGFTPHDFEVDPCLWVKQIHPDDREWVQAEVDRCQATGEPFAADYRILSKDGRIVWFHNEAWLLKDIHGRPLFLQGVGQDITGRKQAEAAFIQEQEEYQTLAESAPLGIAIIGKNGQYKYLNPKFEEMFGYTLEDIPFGRQWVAKAYPDPAYRQQVMTDWKIYLHESQFAETKPRTFTVTCKDGSTKVIHFRAVPLGGGDQLVLYEDITERQEAEGALRESEARFRSLLECAADGFFLHDGGRILEVNQQACDSLGYSREELLTMSVTDIETGVPAEKLTASWLQKTDQPVTFQGTHKRKDGSTFPVEVRSSNFEYQGRRLRLGLARDITERRQAEEALKQSELKYRTLVEQIPAVTYTAALDEQGIKTYVSPQIETLLTLSPSDYEADPNAWVKHLHPDDRDRVLVELEQCLSTGKPFASEDRMVARDGRTVWVRDEARKVEDASSTQRFLQGVMLDITERKELEEALQESEAHYRTLFETSPEAILLFDSDLRLTMANKEAAALYGVERPEEMVGISSFEFVAPESLPLAQKLQGLDP
jgi:PAS domain S-box-containing protein